MTNLTPAQLEQFESTFRYFDKDESNTLNQSEMAAALASLGIVYSVCPLGSAGSQQSDGLYAQDMDMDLIYDQVLQDYGAVTFEAFINLLVRALLCLCSVLESHDGDRLPSWRTRHLLSNCGSLSVASLRTR